MRMKLALTYEVSFQKIFLFVSLISCLTISTDARSPSKYAGNNKFTSNLPASARSLNEVNKQSHPASVYQRRSSTEEDSGDLSTSTTTHSLSSSTSLSNDSSYTSGSGFSNRQSERMMSQDIMYDSGYSFSPPSTTSSSDSYTMENPMYNSYYSSESKSSDFTPSYRLRSKFRKSKDKAKSRPSNDSVRRPRNQYISSASSLSNNYLPSKPKHKDKISTSSSQSSTLSSYFSDSSDPSVVDEGEFIVFLKNKSIELALANHDIKDLDAGQVYEALRQYGIIEHPLENIDLVQNALNEFGVFNVSNDIIKEALNKKKLDKIKGSVFQEYLNSKNVSNLNELNDTVGPGIFKLSTELNILDRIEFAEMNPISRVFFLKDRLYHPSGVENLIVPNKVFNVSHESDLNGNISTVSPVKYKEACIDSTLSDWTYNSICSLADHIQVSPSEWPQKYPMCSSLYQSPVNFEIISTFPCEEEAAINQLSFNHSGTCTFGDLSFDTSVKGWGVWFDGKACGTPPSLTVNGARHVLEKINFHIPSEHSIDGKFFDAEMQFVLFNPEVLTESVRLALFLQIDSELEGYSEIDQFWGRLVYKSRRRDGMKASIERSIMSDIDLVKPLSFLSSSYQYFSYFGSVTTPPCTENVRWAVMLHPWQISPKDYADFSKALTDQNGSLLDQMMYCARPTQPLNEREVHRCSFS